jgi:hypothetical protein
VHSILGFEGFRVQTIKWEADGPRARVLVRIERGGIRGYHCSGCRRWDSKERTWDDVPWAEHLVIVIY